MALSMSLTYDFSSSGSPNNTIELALSSDGTLTIDWGDSSSDPFSSVTISTISHQYTSQTTYTITITGNLLSFGNGASVLPGIEFLTAVNQFSSTLTSLSGAFFGATNLINVPYLSFPSSITDISNVCGLCSSINDSNISLWNVSNVTNMSYAFYQASVFNQSLGGWSVGNVTDMSFMFFGALAFNNGNGPLYWNTSSVTTMQNMFRNAGQFNTDLSYFVGSSVTDISGMFQNALIFNDPSVTTWDVSGVTTMVECFSNANHFNQDISGWNVSNVTNMTRCFSSAASFDRNIGGWNVTNVTSMLQCFDNSGLSSSNFDSILNGWAAQSPLVSGVTLGALNIHYTSTGLTSYNTLRSTPNNWNIVGAIYDSVPCFGQDTDILCYKDGEETYIRIQDLKKGDLVKTCTKGYIPLFAVGHTIIRNDPEVETPNKLYICDDENSFPDMIRPLILTGFHSFLYDSLTKTQEMTMMNLVNKMLVTENKYRLYACADDRVRVFDKEGFFDIYHIALENPDYYMNYGVYANGILVESCSKRYILEYSQMQIISE